MKTFNFKQCVLKARWFLTLSLLLTFGTGRVFASWSGGADVYFCTVNCTNWESAGARFAVCVQNNGQGDQWASMTEVASHIYKCTIPSGSWDALFFCRMNGGNNTNSWDNKWNQCKCTNYSKDDNHRVFVLTYADDNGNPCNHSDNHGTWNTRVVTGGYMYFDNSQTNWSEAKKYFVIGHDTYYKNTEVNTVITNTKLWYFDINDESWGNSKYYAIIAHPTTFTDGSMAWTNISTYADKYTAQYTGVYDLTDGNMYLCVPSGNAAKGQSFSINHQSSYESLNKTITVKAKVSDRTTSGYEETTSPGTLSASSYQFTSKTSCADATSLSSNTITCGYTAETTLSAADASGYTFRGWYNESGDKVSDDASYTIYPKANATYYAYYEKQYTVTLNDQSPTTAGPGNQIVYYGKVPTNLASTPTKTGNGFDGYWTQTSGGIQVIDANGNWNRNVAYHIASDGKWNRDYDETTLYAHWLPVGYYVSGQFNNWAPDPAYHKFDPSTLKVTFGLLKDEVDDITPDLRPKFKIRKVNEGAGSTDKWYGKTSTTFGKDYPTATDLSTGGGDEKNMTLEVYYDGGYIFEISNIDGEKDELDLTVKVPVVDQLQVYSNSCNSTVNQYYDWDGEEATNKVTKTLTLNRCDFYFKPVWDSYYYGKGTVGGGHTTIDRDHLSATGLGTDNSHKENLKLVADLKGDYTFKFDTVAKSIAVVFPDRVQVTYGIYTSGGGTGTAGSVTATNDDDGDVSISTLSNYVVDGNTITLTAPSAKEGYTWQGWYTTNSPDPSSWSTNRISTETSINPAVSSSYKTFYAVYSENDYTVTVEATTGGSIVTPAGGSVTAHAATTAAIRADSSNVAWHFNGWTTESAKVVFGNAKASSTTVTTTENATITANFVPRYALNGSLVSDDSPGHGMPGWEFANAADFEVKSVSAAVGDKIPVNLQCTCTLDPNTTYKFRILDRSINKRRGCSSSSEPGNILPAEDGGGKYKNWTLDYTEGSGAYDVHLKTVGYGTYIFHITHLSNDGNAYPAIQVERQSSKQLTLGKKVIYNDDNSSLTNATTEGSVTAHTNENTVGYDIESGQYFASGSQIVFSADPATGYEVEGWYSDEDCETAYVHDGSSVTISGDKKTMTLSDLDEDKTVYVKFAEKMTTVSLAVYMSEFGPGSITIDDAPAPSSIKVGVHTKYTVKAVPARGYYFEGWALSPATPDFAITGTPADDENDDPEVSGLGGGATSGQVLEANFHDLDKIYFKNWDETANDGAGGPLWDVDNVYVYFNVDWQDDGDVGGVKNLNTHAKMELNRYIGDNIFEAYVPHSFTKSGNGKVAFFDSWQGDAPYAEGKTAWTKSYGGKGVYRTDYNKALDMFVPEHTKADSKNYTDYYSNGYWRSEYISTYRSGYYLKRRKSNNTYWQMGEFKGEDFGRDKHLIFSLRVDNTSADSCKYRIVSAGGENYVAASAIDNTGCTDIQLNVNNTNDSYFTITPTVEGDYLITIDQSGEKMKISVNYPIAVGDYRLKHSYNDGTAKTSYSDVIKSYQAADDTVSMFIYAVDANTDGTIDGSLVLQRCTAITDGKPTWSAGNAVSAYTLANFSKKPGVYKFAVVINTTSHTVTSATEIDLYTGNFYIKTDGAEGEWVRYKVDPDNIMRKNEINFNPEDASSFNYYFCHYYSKARDVYGKDATNIKCVIANDYNNAVSDTLVGDAILGNYTEGGKTKPYESLPIPGSVRFSYNSLTNAVERTYLNGSTLVGESFLYLVTDDDDMIFTSSDESDETDVHDITEGDCKFSDDQNWTYEVLVYAYPTSTAGVKTTYDGHVQLLIPNTHELIGGVGKGGQKYMMKLVYDFKTNYIMSAFTPASAITTNIDDVDVLLVRHAQEAATTITFSGGTLDAQKVIGALRFNNAEMRGNVGSWNEYTRPYLKYFISFPFDVRVRDIFGINSDYGDAYVISRYAGDKRAAKGFFRGDGTTTFWEELTIDSVMHANVGYVVILDNDYFNGTIGNLWEYNPTDIYMYFPSTATIGAITPNETVTINVPQHECKINRTFVDSYTSQTVNHKYTDTDWNLMGVPVFTTVTGDKDGSETYDPGKLFVMTELDTTKAIQYFYKWDYDNEFSIKAAHNYEFLPMHSYMVQYHGSVTFVGTAPTPASVAARRTPEVKKNYQIELQALDMNEQLINRAYVELRENACDTFALNEDVYMSPTNRAINIFTFAGNYDVAANVLSINNHIVPVGYNVRRAGSFTFTMPSNFDGTVTLIDTYTGTRTNLALGDYTVSLPNGANNDRFLLDININQAPTAIDGTDGGSLKDGNAHKYIENGVMYILENGNLYDARGNRVK